MAVEFFMPKVTDNMDTGEIIRWLAKEGDIVQEGQPILEINTDKVAVELESPANGVLKGVRAGAVEGARVPVGEAIAFIADADEKVQVLSTLSSDEARGEKSQPSVAAPADADQGSSGRIRTIPSVRRLAQERGIDLSEVKGTGPEDRITKRDVLDFAAAQAAAPPETGDIVPASPVARRLARDLGVDLAQVTGGGPKGRITREDVQAYSEAASEGSAAQIAKEDEEWLELTQIQRRTGQRMLESVQAAPQFPLTTSVDMTAALQLRAALMDRIVAETGDRLSITAILVKVVSDALKHHPRANAFFDAGRLKLQKGINIGVAVGTDEGLVVPVIKNADEKPLLEIASELKSLQAKAQEMRFGPDDLSGGTFTISNMGMYGIDFFRAIINPPQSAILAVGRIVKTPVGLPDDTIALRPLMSLTLTVDHRSMDGVQAARFLNQIRERLEQPFLLLYA